MFPKTTLFALLVSGLLLSCQGAGTSPEPTPVLTGPTGTFVPDPTALVLPYTEVEAETGQTTGTFAGGSTVLHTPAAEASQRRYVSLDPGRYLELPAPIDANSLVVRYSYPDSTSGEGQTGELWVAVGAAAAVSLGVTSKYSWEYGYANWNSQTNHNSDWSDPPSAGLPRHFWDEANLRVPGFTAGTTVRITNPAGSGVTVLVDLVDFEAVPDAVPAPQGSTTFSGDSTGTQDVTASLQAALNAAAGGTLYLPEGAYRIGSVDVGNVVLQGAGLWRTRLVGPTSRLHFTGGLARVSDMAIFGETSVRNDLSDAENALSGVPGPGSKVERVWIEHKKCGFWFGVWNQSPAPAGITLDGLRIRDTMADGVNLCSGTTDTVVENCLVRNTGDDGLAVWSPTAGGPSGGGNQFRGNLVQLPWLANGIAVYGGGARGQGGVILDQNEVRDTVTTGSGIYVAQAFSSWPLTGAVTISRNILVRAGAHESDVGGSAGAIRIVSSEGSLAAATVTFSDNRIVAPLASAVSIQGGYSVGNLTFTNLLIENLGLALVADVRSGTKGSATFSGVTGGTFADALWVNSAGTAFTLSH